MAYRKVNENSLQSLANVIRSKSGGTDELVFPDGFISAVAGIEAGSGSGSAETVSVNISASSVTLDTMMLISGDDGAITSFTATSLTVPINSALAIYATALGGTSSAVAHISAAADAGSVFYLIENSSSVVKTLATAVILVRITGNCNVVLKRTTGSGSVV